MNFIKNKIKNIFAKYGYQISLKSKVDDENISELSRLIFKRYLYCNPILHLNMNFGLSGRGYRLANDPRIILIKDLLEVHSEEEFVRCLTRELNVFQNYEKYRGLSINEVYGLKSSMLTDIPFWAFVRPWDNISPEYKVKNYPNQIVKNRREHGMSFDKCKDDNHIIEHAFKNGNYSQARQYFKLINSLKKYGYKQDLITSEIVSDVLIDNNKWAWQVSYEGNHRTEVLSLFDYQFIRTRVRKYVYRHEVDSWPNVMNRSFSKEDALSIFDKCLSGEGIRSF